MIDIKNMQSYGFEAAVRGMRNPMNSWEDSDSEVELVPLHEKVKNAMGFETIKFTGIDKKYIVGPKDIALMQKLIRAGTDHSKFMRMITASMDITAPLYWWKEFDTYKVGTATSSCSTMHKIMSEEFRMDNFSFDEIDTIGASYQLAIDIVKHLNILRDTYHRFKTRGDATAAKQVWYEIIQLLPSSYNQKRTVVTNYQALRNIYHARKDHKLLEWRDFCYKISYLEYAMELIVPDFKAHCK